MAADPQDANNFQKHSEAMKVFRLLHVSPRERLPFGDIPAAHEINSTRGKTLITCITDAKGKIILVPIWHMTLPPGSGN